MIERFLPVLSPSSSRSLMLGGKLVVPLVVVVLVMAGASTGALLVLSGTTDMIISTLVTATVYVPDPALCATELEIAAEKAEASAVPNIAVTFEGLLEPTTGLSPGIVIT